MPLAKKKKNINAPGRVLTMFKPQIRSRHDTHDHLRNNLPKMPFKSVIRLGSTTEMVDTVAKGGKRIEINTVEAVKNSANKRLMKKCFTEAGVKTAKWCDANAQNQVTTLEFPVVVKNIYGSRGNGNHLIKTLEDFNNWKAGKELNNYIVEEFHNYNREYRLHITKDGCFYTCRKLLKNDTPENKRWFRNDSNCNWVVEDNPSFDKPTNWNQIVSECVKALKATKLDIGGFDVRVQSAKDNNNRVRQNPEFIIIESNSACSHGRITAEKYKAVLPGLLRDKKNNV